MVKNLEKKPNGNIPRFIPRRHTDELKTDFRI